MTGQTPPGGKRARLVTPIVRSVPAPRDPSELEPLREEAFQGLAGEIVRKIAPHTEADLAAILVQLLAACGNAIGRGPGFQIEASRHHANLFVGIVGKTAAARKGTSLGQALHLVRQADPQWATRIKSGASSGEGLIWKVRDPSEGTGKQPDDPGADDKRLFIVETELASPLERMGIAGNTLSPVLRQAWDGEKLDTLVKTSRATATNAHLSLVGHITVEELQRKLTATEQVNGFANRFLWVFAERSQLLPRGGDIGSVDWSAILKRLKKVLRATSRRDFDMTDGAWRLWDAVYPALSTPPPGMLGAATARGPAQVRRLALIYAVLGGVRKVSEEHLRAALAVWLYSADSSALLFGTSLGDPVADAILRWLRANPAGMTRGEIHDAASRHWSAAEMDGALERVADHGLAHCEAESTGGRPAHRWIATNLDGKRYPRTKRTKRTKPRPKRPQKNAQS